MGLASWSAGRGGGPYPNTAVLKVGFPGVPLEDVSSPCGLAENGRADSWEEEEAPCLWR